MKRFIPPFLRQAVRKGLGRCGYELLNRRELGRDWPLDVDTLSGGCPPQVIFDVGANTGQCLGRLARQFPQAALHAFEPFPDACAALRQMAAAQPRVTVHELALGEADGEHLLHVNQADVTNSLLPTAPEAARYAPAGWQETRRLQRVPVRRLDTVCRELGLANLDLLKVDAQGYELRILQGAGDWLRERRIRFLLLEVLFVPLYEGQAYFHEVYHYLWEAGYQWVGLYEVNRAKNGAAQWADGLWRRTE